MEEVVEILSKFETNWSNDGGNAEVWAVAVIFCDKFSFVRFWLDVR